MWSGSGQEHRGSSRAPFFQPPGPLQDWQPRGFFQALSLFRTALLAGEELLPDTGHTSLKETTYTATSLVRKAV